MDAIEHKRSPTLFINVEFVRLGHSMGRSMKVAVRAYLFFFKSATNFIIG